MAQVAFYLRLSFSGSPIVLQAPIRPSPQAARQLSFKTQQHRNLQGWLGEWERGWPRLGDVSLCDIALSATEAGKFI